MANETAERFMKALQEAESIRDAGPLVELFDGEAELENLTTKSPVTGRDGARQFWTKYLDSFGRIASTFTNVVETGDAAVLEWVSEGTLPDGRPLRYRGVSVLEIADGHVRRFRAYYDSAAFVAQTADAQAARS